jgi:hypothetical protein
MFWSHCECHERVEYWWLQGMYIIKLMANGWLIQPLNIIEILKIVCVINV